MTCVPIVIAAEHNGRNARAWIDAICQYDRFLAGWRDRVAQIAHHTRQRREPLRVGRDHQHTNGLGQHSSCDCAHAGFASMVTLLVTMAPARARMTSIVLPIFAAPS